jgi:Tol biopolymer transport system component
VQISNAGGRRPIWAPDGKTIYFWEGSRLASATIARDPALRVAARRILFDGRYEVDFDISRDGTRFLMIESESSGLGLVAVPNWLSELKQSSAARKP